MELFLLFKTSDQKAMVNQSYELTMAIVIAAVIADVLSINDNKILPPLTLWFQFQESCVK